MTSKVRAFTAAATVLAAAAVIAAGIATPLSQACAAAQSFAEDVMPIFRGRCVSCHAPGKEGFEKSGLDLTTYEGVMKGTKYGAMVIPRDPDGSNLMWLLDWRGSAQTRMPHGKKKLSTCDRDAIRAWIREGAKNT